MYNVKTSTYLLVCTLLLSISVYCTKFPSESPKRDNPFDPMNDSTAGDPFKVTAKLLDSSHYNGVSVNWRNPHIKSLREYALWRSSISEIDSTAPKLIAKVANDWYSNFITINDTSSLGLGSTVIYSLLALFHDNSLDTTKLPTEFHSRSIYHSPPAIICFQASVDSSQLTTETSFLIEPHLSLRLASKDAVRIAVGWDSVQSWQLYNNSSVISIDLPDYLSNSISELPLKVSIEYKDDTVAIHHFQYSFIPLWSEIISCGATDNEPIWQAGIREYQVVTANSDILNIRDSENIQWTEIKIIRRTFNQDSIYDTTIFKWDFINHRCITMNDFGRIPLLLSNTYDISKSNPKRDRDISLFLNTENAFGVRDSTQIDGNINIISSFTSIGRVGDLTNKTTKNRYVWIQVDAPQATHIALSCNPIDLSPVQTKDWLRIQDTIVWELNFVGNNYGVKDVFAIFKNSTNLISDTVKGSIEYVINMSPTLSRDSLTSSIYERDTHSIVPFALKPLFIDNDKDQLTLRITESITISGLSTARSSIERDTLFIRYDANDNGDIQIKIIADDNDGGTSPELLVQFNVTPVNDAPTLLYTQDSLSIEEGGRATFEFTCQDIDFEFEGDTLSCWLDTTSIKDVSIRILDQDLTKIDNNQYNFSVDIIANFNSDHLRREETLLFCLQDGSFTIDSTFVHLSVSDVDRIPEVDSTWYHLYFIEDQPVTYDQPDTVSLLKIFSDPDGDPLQFWLGDFYRSQNPVVDTVIIETLLPISSPCMFISLIPDSFSLDPSSTDTFRINARNIGDSSSYYSSEIYVHVAAVNDTPRYIDGSIQDTFTVYLQNVEGITYGSLCKITETFVDVENDNLKYRALPENLFWISEVNDSLYYNLSVLNLTNDGGMQFTILAADSTTSDRPWRPISYSTLSRILIVRPPR